MNIPDLFAIGIKIPHNRHFKPKRFLQWHLKIYLQIVWG